jgi:hypothetical protein
MMQSIDAPMGLISFDWRRLPQQFFVRTAPGAAALAVGALVGAWILHTLPAAAPKIAKAPEVKAIAVATLAANPYGALVDPGFSRSVAPASPATRSPTPAPLGKSRSLEANLTPAPPAPSVAALAPAAAIPAPPAAPPAPAAATAAPNDIPLPPMRAASQPADDAPTPPHRPAEFASPTSPLLSIRRLAQQNDKAPSAAAPDNRSFIEKLFGVGQPSSGPALASASPGSRVTLARLEAPSSPAPAGYDRFTAIYDVAAHTVYLPNGTKLEAHSGLGDRLDDPRHVNERDRGATPPHLYDLSPREESFHGVQALRLNPVGAGDLFGRAGLLAHPYMLGPNGDSNGCVSFKDYEAFLQAYQNGQVKRLAVVSSLN